MGFDVRRFKGEINPDLICTICSDVFEDPVQRLSCEHYFCRKCITSWLKQTPTCPIDRQHLTESDLKDAPRIVMSFLSLLDINCDFASLGCSVYVKWALLADHVKGCKFNPEAVVTCSNGCGRELKRMAVSSHDCLTHLLDVVKDLEAVRRLLEKERMEGKEKDKDIMRLTGEIRGKENTISQMRANQQKKDTDLTQLRSEIEKERNKGTKLMKEKEMLKKGNEREAKMRIEKQETEMKFEAKVKQLQDINKCLLVGNETLRADKQKLRSLLDAKHGDDSQFESTANFKPFESLRVTSTEPTTQQNATKSSVGPFGQTANVKPNAIFQSLKVDTSILAPNVDNAASIVTIKTSGFEATGGAWSGTSTGPFRQSEYKTDFKVTNYSTSEAHQQLVNDLLEDGHITCDKVYNSLIDIDFKDFFDGDPYDKKTALDVVKHLQMWAPYVKQGSKILHLFAGFDTTTVYEQVSLAYWVGAKGLVVGLSEDGSEIAKILKNHGHVLASGTLRVWVTSDVSSFPKNEFKFDFLFVNFLKESESFLNLLKPRGTICCHYSTLMHQITPEGVIRYKPGLAAEATVGNEAEYPASSSAGFEETEPALVLSS